MYGCVSPCVVIGIQIAAYEAFWQEHNAVVPIYWPRRVALSVSEGPPPSCPRSASAAPAAPRLTALARGSLPLPRPPALAPPGALRRCAFRTPIARIR